VTDGAIPNNKAAVSITPLTGSDADGFVAGFTLVSLPPAGAGQLMFRGVAATIGTLVPADEAGELSFDPAAGYSGTPSFTYSATDNAGLESAAPATYTLTIEAPLPVVLTRFTAQAVHQDAVLRWSTTAEKNHDYFAIERSLDGREFTTIGQVRGQGRSSGPGDYRFVDAGAGQARRTQYYRLRQVDLDDATSYSPVQAVRFDRELPAPSFAVYPNPATALAWADLRTLPAGDCRVTVRDLAGRSVAGYTLPAGSVHPLDLSLLPAGSYVLSVSGAGLPLTQRLVKE
jgi:hypothetical protein